MPVFVNAETGEVLHVCPEGMGGAHALLSLGFTLQGENTPVNEPKVPAVSDEVVVESAPIPGAPSKRASRKEWATYAKTLGVEPGVLNRGELIAAVEALN